MEAAVELHTILGPARTTIAAIAERAGVRRATVYSHFPDQRSLFRACSGYALEADPPPDGARWSRVRDPETRLRGALEELYGYYRRNQMMLAHVIRDAPLLPVVREVSAPWQEAGRKLHQRLVTGWQVRGQRRRRLVAFVGHALEFSTWQSLAERHGLSDEEAAEAMVALVCQAGGRDPRSGGRSNAGGSRLPRR